MAFTDRYDRVGGTLHMIRRILRADPTARQGTIGDIRSAAVEGRILTHQNTAGEALPATAGPDPKPTYSRSHLNLCTAGDVRS